MAKYNCSCGEPAFAVICGEEGFPVCFDHFFKQIKEDVEYYLKQAVGNTERFQIHCFFKNDEPIYLPFASYLQLGENQHCWDKSDNWKDITPCKHEKYGNYVYKSQKFHIAKAFENDPVYSDDDQLKYCDSCGVNKLQERKARGRIFNTGKRND
jgi:hypothetical protein